MLLPYIKHGKATDPTNNTILGEMSSILSSIQSRVRSAVEERGLSADEILSELHEEATRTLLEGQEKSAARSAPEEDNVPSEIRLISQALAYRRAETSDLESLCQLLNRAYQPEILKGSRAATDESFRCDPTAILEETIRYYLEQQESGEYQWLIVEAPSGCGIEEDGAILGCCCYSTKGVARRNGQVVGTTGSIRYLAVEPRYHGLCIGRRLLSKVEDSVEKAGCVTLLICVPSSRTSMSEWLQRRGYQAISSLPYPFESLHHTPINEEIARPTTLLQYIKGLQHSSESAAPEDVHAAEESKVNSDFSYDKILEAVD